MGGYDPSEFENRVSAISKLDRFGRARDRAIDPEPREVVLTDDEAAALYRLLETEGLC